MPLDKFASTEIAGINKLAAEYSTGRTYYVNNISGSSSANGLTWETAMDQISTAITASETYRQLYTGTTNDYIRNRIIVQGTETAYDCISALPNYTDLIGLGANPTGNGGGIVIIGGTASTDAVAGTQRGNTWTNFQFQISTDGYWCFDCVQSLRSVFTNCAFMGSTSLTGAPTTAGGFRVTGNSGGMLFDRCHFGTNGAGRLAYGIYVTSGCTFNNSVVRFCTITVSNTGITFQEFATDSIIHDCYIYSGTSSQMTVGIASGINNMIANCFINANDAISGATAANTVGNQVVNNGTAARELA